MAIKLQELVGLCDEKNLFLVQDYSLITATCHLRKVRVEIDLLDINAPEQLQEAIDKVSAL